MLLVALFGMFIIAAIAFQYSVLVGLIVCLPTVIIWTAIGLSMFQGRET